MAKVSFRFGILLYGLMPNGITSTLKCQHGTVMVKLTNEDGKILVFISLRGEGKHARSLSSNYQFQPLQERRGGKKHRRRRRRHVTSPLGLFLFIYGFPSHHHMATEGFCSLNVESISYLLYLVGRQAIAQRHDDVIRTINPRTDG
jgi:hypothetical protein